MEKQNLPMKSEQTTSINKHEAMVVAACNTMTIKEASDKDIRSLIVYINTMVGIKSLPSDIEDLVLLDYIKSSLANYTLDEFKLAFTLYCDGKLSENREHFQSLSTLYLGRIMESYARWRYQYFHDINRVVLDLPAPPDKQTDEKLKEGVIRVFKKYKQNGLLLDFGNVYFRFLERIEVIVLTNKRKDEIYIQAEQIYRVREAQDAASAMDLLDVIRDADKVNDATKEKIRMVAREIALKEYFDMLIESDITIEDALNKQI